MTELSNGDRHVQVVNKRGEIKSEHVFKKEESYMKMLGLIFAYTVSPDLLEN